MTIVSAPNEALASRIAARSEHFPVNVRQTPSPRLESTVSLVSLTTSGNGAALAGAGAARAKNATLIGSTTKAAQLARLKLRSPFGRTPLAPLRAPKAGANQGQLTHLLFIFMNGL